MPERPKPAGGPVIRRVCAPLVDVELRESQRQDGTLTLAGHAAVFERLSLDLGGYREKIARGAFTRVLDGNPDVHLVVGHDMTRAIARTRSKTLDLSEDPKGLRVWARIDPEDPDVKSLVPKMRRGDVDQMSFAFIVERDEWKLDENDEITRTVLEVRDLYDVSVVAQGAYPQTDAALRGLLDAAISEGRLPATVGAARQSARPDDPVSADSAIRSDDPTGGYPERQRRLAALRARAHMALIANDQRR